MEKNNEVLSVVLSVFFSYVADQILWCTYYIYYILLYYIILLYIICSQLTMCIPTYIGCPRIVAKVTTATPFDCDLLFSLLMMGDLFRRNLG